MSTKKKKKTYDWEYDDDSSKNSDSSAKYDWEYSTEEDRSDDIVSAYNEMASKYDADLKSYLSGGNVDRDSLDFQENRIRSYLDANKSYLGAGNEARSYLDEAQKARYDYEEYTRKLGYADKYGATKHAERTTSLDDLKNQITAYQTKIRDKTATDKDFQDYNSLVNEYKYLLDYDSYAGAGAVKSLSGDEQIRKYNELSASHDVFSKIGSNSSAFPIPQGYDDTEAQYQMEQLEKYGDPMTQAYIRQKKYGERQHEADTLDLQAREMDVDRYGTNMEAAEQYARAKSEARTEQLNEAELLYTQNRKYERSDKILDNALLVARENGDTVESIAQKASAYLSEDIDKAWDDVTNLGRSNDLKGQMRASGYKWLRNDDGTVSLYDSDGREQSDRENSEDFSSYISGTKLKAKYPDLYRLLEQYDSGSTDVGLLDFVSKDDLTMLSYFLSTEGKDAAKQYADDLKGVLERRKDDYTNGQMQKLADSGFFGRAAATGVKVVGDIAGAPFSFGSDLVNTLSGNEIDPYDEWHNLSNAAEAAGTAVSENLARRYPNFKIFGQNGASFLYNALVSGAESLIGAKSVGKAYTFIMGMNAAQQRAKELYERGASNEDIFTGSLTAGVNEALFEYVSLDHFLSTESPTSWIDGLKKLLAQAGVEGSEEVATSIANNIADGLNLGVNSDFNVRIRELQEQGLSFEEARRQAGEETIKEIVADGLAGAISSLSMGGNIMTQAVQNQRTGKNIQRGATADYFVEAGLNEDADSRAYKLANEIRKEGAYNVNSMKLGALANDIIRNSNNISAEKREELQEYTKKATNRKAIEQRLRDGGVREDRIELTTDAVIKTINGEQTNRKESRAVEYQDAAQNYVNEVQNKQADIIGEINEADVQTLTGQVLSNARAVRTEENTKALARAPLGEASIREANTVREGTRISEDNTARDSQGNEIDLGNSKVVSLDNGVATIELNDGNRTQVKTSDITFANNDQAVIYETLANVKGMTPENMNFFVAMRKSVDTDINAGVWAQGIAEGYNLGYTFADNQRGLAKAEQSARYLSNISNDMRLKAEEYGKDAAHQNAKRENQSTVRDERNIRKGETLEQQHKRAQDVAKKLGYEIVYNDNIKGDGKYIDGKTVYMRHDVVDPVAFVLKHEITHSTEKTKSYANFIDAVEHSKAFENWLKGQTSGGTLAQMKAEYKAEVTRRYRSEGVDTDTANGAKFDAAHEMYANFVGDTLFTEDGVGLEGLVKGMSKVHRNAVVRFFEKIIEKVKSLLGDKAPETRRLERMMRGMLNEVESTSEGKQSGEAQRSIPDRTAKTEANNYTVREIEKLNETVKNLKEMLKLQATETHGTIMTKASVNRATDSLMNKWGIKAGKGVLSNMLSDFYTELAEKVNTRELVWDDVEAMAKPVVDYITSMFDYDIGSDIAEDVYNDERKNAMLDVYESFFEANATETYADKMAKQLNTLRAKKNLQIETLRNEKNAKIAEEKAKRAKLRDERKKTQHRQNIKKIVGEFNSALKHGTDSKYIQQDKVKAVVDLLSAINKNMNTALEDKWTGYTDERGVYHPGYLERMNNARTQAEYDQIERIAQREAARQQKEQIRTEALDEWYESLKNDPDYADFYDSHIAEKTAALVKEIGTTSIARMTSSQLQLLDETLSAVNHMIKEGRRISSIDSRVEAAQYAENLARETLANVDKHSTGKEQNANVIKGVGQTAASLYHDYVQMQESPSTFFWSLGGFAKNSLWRSVGQKINDAQRQMISYLVEGEKMFRHLLDDTKNFNKLREDVDLGFTDENGNPVTVSRGMMLQIRRGLMDVDYARDIREAGMHIPDAGLYYKGKPSKAFDNNSHTVNGTSVEVADLARELKHQIANLENAKNADEASAIEKRINKLNDKISKIDQRGQDYAEQLAKTIDNQLTEYEKQWLDVAEEFFKWSGELFNKTTLETYGYKHALNEHYLPINVSELYINKDMDLDAVMKAAMSLENLGFTIERTGAASVVKIEDLTDVMNRHLKNISNYAALMPILKDFNKIYKWSTIKNGERVGVRKSIQDTLGKRGNQYIRNVIADLVGSRNGGDQTFLDTFRGGYAAAVLTMNAKTALVQTASIFTAVSEVGYKPVLKALMRGGRFNAPIIGGAGVKSNLIGEYTPLFDYRKLGYNLPELADIRNQSGKVARAMRKAKFLTGWINTMDLWTTGRLWDAAMYKVNQDIKKGRYEGLEKVTLKEARTGEFKNPQNKDAYFKQVAKVYNDIIENTQPNYTTFQRSDILRNPNKLVKSLVQFQTQRQQDVNILGEATAVYNKYHEDYKARKKGSDVGRNGVTLKDVREARKKFVWAATSQTVSALTIAVFSVISMFALHRTDKLRDEDGELTLESIGKSILNYFFNSGVSNFIGAGELYQAVDNAIEGKKYYGITVNGINVLQDTANGIYDIASAITNMAEADDDSKYGKAKDNLLYAAKEMGFSIANMLGLPVENAYKIEQSAQKYVTELFNASPIFSLDESYTSTQNTKRLYDAIMSGDYKNVDKVKHDFDSEEDYQNAVKQGLRKYEPRIKKAAKAYYNGETEKAAELSKQIWKVERKFNKTQVEGAIKAELDKIKRDNAPEEETNDEWRDEDLQAGDTSDENVFVGTTWLSQDLENGNIDSAVSNAASLVEQGKNPASTISKHYESSYIEAYKKGDTKTQNAILADIRKFHDAGVWKSSAEDVLEGWKEKNGLGENPTTLKNSFDAKDYTKAASIAVAMAKRGKDATGTVRNYYKDMYINNPSQRTEIKRIIKDIDKALEKAGYDLYKKDIDDVLDGWLD